MTWFPGVSLKETALTSGFSPSTGRGPSLSEEWQQKTADIAGEHAEEDACACEVLYGSAAQGVERQALSDVVESLATDGLLRRSAKNKGARERRVAYRQARYGSWVRNPLVVGDANRHRVTRGTRSQDVENVPPPDNGGGGIDEAYRSHGKERRLVLRTYVSVDVDLRADKMRDPDTHFGQIAQHAPTATPEYVRVLDPARSVSSAPATHVGSTEMSAPLSRLSSFAVLSTVGELKEERMREFIKKRPVLNFSVFIVVWTWILMAVIIALVPVDPVAGPQFVHVALVFFVASASYLVRGFLPVHPRRHRGERPDPRALRRGSHGTRCAGITSLCGPNRPARGCHGGVRLARVHAAEVVGAR